MKSGKIEMRDAVADFWIARITRGLKNITCEMWERKQPTKLAEKSNRGDKIGKIKIQLRCCDVFLAYKTQRTLNIWMENILYPVNESTSYGFALVNSLALFRVAQMGVKQTYESDKSLKNSFSWAVGVEESERERSEQMW